MSALTRAGTRTDSVRTQTTRYSCEINMKWAHDNPELFLKAINDFIEDAVQLDLFDVSMQIDRVHYVTLIAEIQQEDES